MNEMQRVLDQQVKKLVHFDKSFVVVWLKLYNDTMSNVEMS